MSVARVPPPPAPPHKGEGGRYRSGGSEIVRKAGLRFPPPPRGEGPGVGLGVGPPLT